MAGPPGVTPSHGGDDVPHGDQRAARRAPALPATTSRRSLLAAAMLSPAVIAAARPGSAPRQDDTTAPKP
ncbi:MAG: hypothetical protein WBB09_17225, partial [Candidatus Microthrix parvicella]